jgi:endoglucanase
LKGFVHAEAGNLVDGHGEPLVLRGVGLGNWLLPEGYMWMFEPPGPQSPREIESLVQGLVGPVPAAKFWRRFRATFITEEDIARIRAEGMNHVRLPINSHVVMDDDGQLIEPGFTLIDQLIEWCRRHELWVVLDLHGAPGGQTGTNIDDSPCGHPQLFTDERYRALALRLWRALAQRYRNETVVAAYDLLNEPLPNQYQHSYADQLRDLYVELTAAIREVDPNHAISYEGTHWATNWSIFTEMWDPNSILQFHKYWSAPDRPSIKKYLDIGHELGLPIYMGEGGENNLSWIQIAFQLYDDCDISWNFWPWKKVETFTSPCSVDAPAGWSGIVDYAAGKGPKPAAADARQTLDALVDAMSFSRCSYRSEVISALLRRPPLKIPAVGFSFGGAGKSYKTSDAVPLPDFRKDDLVTIRHASDLEPQALEWHYTAGAALTAEEGLIVSLGKGDWVAYDIATTAAAQLQLSVALKPVPAMTVDPQALDISVDGADQEVDPAADGLLARATTSRLEAGRHVLRLTGCAPETLVHSIEVTDVAADLVEH